MDSRHLHGIILVVLLTIAISQPAGAMTAEEWYDKGLALYQQGKYADAIKAYDRAVTLDPTVATFWNGLGSALDHEGDYIAAIRAYSTAIELDPTDAFAWNNKGISLDNLGNHTEAVAAFDRAIALDPKSAEAKRNRERAVAKAQGSGNATGSTTAMPAGEPVPFETLLALAIGTVGLAGAARVRRK